MTHIKIRQYRRHRMMCRRLRRAEEQRRSAPSWLPSLATVRCWVAGAADRGTTCSCEPWSSCQSTSTPRKNLAEACDTLQPLHPQLAQLVVSPVSGPEWSKNQSKGQLLYLAANDSNVWQSLEPPLCATTAICYAQFLNLESYSRNRKQQRFSNIKSHFILEYFAQSYPGVIGGINSE